jgi:SAM-dependent methyltransferase
LDRILVALRLLAPTEFSAKTFYANLLRPFPWSDNAVEAIYLGEILEHFTLEEGQRVLHECYRVLKPGGRLRIRVPDHARFWKNYVDEYECTKQKAREDWSLAHTRWTEMYFDNLCTSRLRCWQSIGHYHKWMYDEISLILLVEAIGFQCVERSTFHQSRIPQIEEVEVRDDLIVEALHP